jgi:hypothetical protein
VGVSVGPGSGIGRTEIRIPSRPQVSGGCAGSCARLSICNHSIMRQVPAGRASSNDMVRQKLRQLDPAQVKRMLLQHVRAHILALRAPGRRLSCTLCAGALMPEQAVPYLSQAPRADQGELIKATV